MQNDFFAQITLLIPDTFGQFHKILIQESAALTSKLLERGSFLLEFTISFLLEFNISPVPVIFFILFFCYDSKNSLKFK